MILKSVIYRSFRNIGEAQLFFEPGVNLLYGENAQGKTNALEGIYLCAQGRSHRTAKERDYIRLGDEAALVRLTYEDARRTQTLELRCTRAGRKYCRKNGMPVGRMSEFIGNFRAVIFCPEHLSIVKEGPAERRGFLDTALCQTDQTYLAALQQYSTALSQRNRLISEYPFRPEPFLETQELWAEQMAQSGEILYEKRAAYLETAEKAVIDIFRDMMGEREHPRLLYKKKYTKEELLRLYTEEKDKELRAGSSQFGPHKDDFEILLNDRSARVFASQGQQKSLAVALKLAEGLISREKTGEYPVFLLDDVLSELDARRKSYILGGLEGKQAIITCCDKNDAAEFPKGRVIRVENGQYTQIR